MVSGLARRREQLEPSDESSSEFGQPVVSTRMLVRKALYAALARA